MIIYVGKSWPMNGTYVDFLSGLTIMFMASKWYLFWPRLELLFRGCLVTCYKQGKDLQIFQDVMVFKVLKVFWFLGNLSS